MKIFKTDFYIALSNFIERFFVWLLEDKHIDINNYVYVKPKEENEELLKIEHTDV